MKNRVQLSSSITRSLVSLGFLLSTLIMSLTLSWLVCASADFFYGSWHDHVGIDEAIEKFAPQNRYKQGFEKTTREERIRAFSEINRAIHNDGLGLADIGYTLPNGYSDTLLRDPEVVHLNDVANVISFLKWLVLVNVLVWLVLVCILTLNCRMREAVSWRSQGIALLGFIGLSLVVLFIVGAENVFNQLHIWVFPDDHAWFFFYQDSLMSTMMYAPVLFAWIAAAIAVIGVLFFCALLGVVLGLQRRVSLPRSARLAE